MGKESIRDLLEQFRLGQAEVSALRSKQNIRQKKAVPLNFVIIEMIKVSLNSNLVFLLLTK